MVRIRKYQFMEDQMLRKRRSLEEKIPELDKTLEAVKFFISQKVHNFKPDHFEELQSLNRRFLNRITGKRGSSKSSV